MKAKMLLATVGFDPPSSWAPLGAHPPDPHYRLALPHSQCALPSELLDLPVAVVNLWRSV